MEPLLEEIRIQVTCSICHDTYTNPKMIPCLHTFCLECLKEHARVSHRQRKFQCPECMAETDLPEGNCFDSFRTSFHHNSLLSILKTGEDREVLLRPPFCSQHKNERIRYFCSSCEACICPVCFSEYHRSHEFELIENEAKKDKVYIKSNVETIKEKAKLFRDEIEKLDKTSDQVKMIIAIARREVCDAAEHVIKTTQQQKNELLGSLDMTRKKRIERINSAKQKLESLVKQIDQAAEFAESLVQRSSSFDIIQTKAILRNKFEDLRRVEVPKHRQATFAKFTASSQQDLKLGIIQLTEKPTNAAKCTLEGLDQTFQASIAAQLTLCPKTAEGVISNHADLKDQIELLIEPADDVTNVIVQEREDGNLRLMFTPKVPGEYSVEVKVNGEKLPTCPFTLSVKEREIVVAGELDLKFIPGLEFKGPCGIAVNRQGDIAVVDNLRDSVFVFNKEGNCLNQIGKEGTDPGQLKNPTGVLFLNDNEILIADHLNDRIQHINIKTETVLKIFGQKGEGKGHFQAPLSVCLDDTERIIVTECRNQRVQVMSKEGETIFTIGDSGPERLRKPYSCIPYKNTFLVTERGSCLIKAFDSSGTFLYKFGGSGKKDGQLNTPCGMCLDGSSNLLVCDYGNNRVLQFSLDGRFTGKTIVPLQGPNRIVTTPDGRILVVCKTAKKICILK